MAMIITRSALFWWCSLVAWIMLRIIIIIIIIIMGGAGAGAVAGAGSDEEVRYDGRSLIINGQRKLLFSGSIHYPRSTPQLWPSLISKAKEGGLDVIQTYVFWNLHEPQPGQYDFRGRRDLVRFIKEVAAQGLYVSLRVGPFIEAEWAYGGLPFWLHDIPGIVFRSDNEPFKMHMQSFTSKIVNMMKSEKLYASQGGPIILSQIENEYQNVEKAFREKGPSYVKWAAEMVVGLQTGVPWMMCKQEDAPDPVINACNGLKCGMNFVPNSPNKPSIWAENWTSQYQVYGEIARSRSPEDIAFHVALFVAKNGSFVNYYMYHGGTNFGRAASAYVTTSYYDEAPLDEYGMKRQPKWGHLMELHAAIKQCTNALLGGAHTILPLGQQQTAYVFREHSGECAAFLVNIDKVQSVSVSFQSSFYNLPPKSISILPNCKDVSFNTAKVNTPYSTRSMVPVKKFNAAEMWVEFREAIPNYEDTSTRSKMLLEQMNTTKDVSDYLWYTFREAIPNYEDTSTRSKMLLEQMNTTKDVSDYLWYTFRFRHQFGPSTAILNAYSLGHVLHAFVNGVHVGSAHGSHSSRDFTLETAITLNNGINRVALLSAMVGLPDSGAYMERKAAGIRRVSVHGLQNVKDFSNHAWGYQVGLLGERLQFYSYRGSSQVQWTKFSSSHEPLTWYKTVFDAPSGDEPVALDLGSMGKGETWINGESIGRYWVSFRASDGSPAQRWYNVPWSFLRPTGNLLVIVEEEGGSPLDISLDIVSTRYV